MELTAKLATVDEFLAGECGRGPVVGDVLAFRGTSPVDRFIQDATRSEISHVAILIEPPGGELSVLEATGAGVSVTPLAKSLAGYQEKHSCFYLPLADASSRTVIPALLLAYYTANAEDRYNYAGVAAAGLYDIPRLRDHLRLHFDIEEAAEWFNQAGERFWDGIWGLDRSYKRLFCSQLVTAALLATQVALPGPPDARLVVPVEVCRFGIYADAYQLYGPPLAQPFRIGGQA
jgi:hypothetical protein